MRIYAAAWSVRYSEAVRHISRRTLREKQVDRYLHSIFSTFLITTTSSAQAPAPSTNDSGNAAQVAPPPDQSTGEKPPAAVGEEGKKATGVEDTKPARGFVSAPFAAATVLQQHLGYKAAIPTYLVASYVAMSRLHDNRHYASDVIFGAATGIVVGRSVTWHGRNFFASPMLVPGGAGIQLIAVR